MKLIILDHFRRWWWVWLLGGVLYGVITVAICDPVGDKGHMAGAATGAIPLGVYLGSLLLSFDLQRANARVLLAMPVTSKQVARAWWWAVVGIPAVLLAVIAIIGFGISFLIYSEPPLLIPAVVNWLVNFLLLGITFFALTGMRSGGFGTVGWKQQVRGICSGMLFGGSIGGSMMVKHLDFHTLFGAGVLVMAVVLTVAGWFLSEALVRERASFRPGSPPLARRSAATSRSAEGHGGLLLLAQSIFTRMTLMGLLMSGMFLAIMASIYAVQVDDFKSNNIFSDNMFSIWTLQYLWFMNFAMFAFAAHVRSLRAMPVSAGKLARVLVLTPLAAMTAVFFVTLWAAAGILRTPLPGLETLIQTNFLLQISAATIAVPLLVWRGVGIFSCAIGMGVLLAGMLGTMFLQERIPLPLNLAVSVLSVLVAWIATKLLLERSSHVYRPRTSQFGGWCWAGGR